MIVEAEHESGAGDLFSYHAEFTSIDKLKMPVL
jgi:hypothetical protein